MLMSAGAARAWGYGEARLSGDSWPTLGADGTSRQMQSGIVVNAHADMGASAHALVASLLLELCTATVQWP